MAKWGLERSFERPGSAFDVCSVPNNYSGGHSGGAGDWGAGACS